MRLPIVPHKLIDFAGVEALVSILLDDEFVGIGGGTVLLESTNEAIIQLKSSKTRLGSIEIF